MGDGAIPVGFVRPRCGRGPSCGTTGLATPSRQSRGGLALAPVGFGNIHPGPASGSPDRVAGLPAGLDERYFAMSRGKRRRAGEY